MYCIHCGADGAAKFCARCGKSQAAAQDISREVQLAEVVEMPHLVQPPGDWTETLDYAELLRHDEPRARIAAAARLVKSSLSSEDLLSVLDAVSPIGVSWSKLTGAIVPIFDKLGFHTSQQAQGAFQAPPGRVLLATLCTLARKSLAVKDVHQAQGECSIVADIPLGLITNPGHIITTLQAADGYVLVSLATRISGQWYDWGKSKRLTEEIFALMHADLRIQQAGAPTAFRRVA